MQRMPLVELCLQIKLLSLGHIKPFLSEVVNYILFHLGSHMILVYLSHKSCLCYSTS